MFYSFSFFLELNKIRMSKENEETLYNENEDTKNSTYSFQIYKTKKNNTSST